MLNAEINRTRLIGCEYEFVLPCTNGVGGSQIQQTLANIFTANGVRAAWRSYSHEPVPPGCDLMVETDSSVQGESRWAGIAWQAIEMKTRPLTYTEWQRIVPKALAIASYMGGRVNASAGHHVHISLPEITTDPKALRSIYNVFHKFENVLFGMLAPSRKHNRYCQQIPANRFKLLQHCKSLDCFRKALTDGGLYDRYSALNFTHAFGTPESRRLEARHHHGTLDAKKAEMWVRTLLQLTQHAVTRTCQASEQLPNSKQSLERFLTSTGFKSVTGIYGVSDELKECGRYLRQRWNHFSGTSEADRIIDGSDESEGR